jgi:hypothetical protein
MLVHRLHAWKQPLSVILPGPIPLVRKGFYFHLVIHFSALFALSGRPASLNGPQIVSYILGEHMANRKGVESGIQTQLAIGSTPARFSDRRKGDQLADLVRVAESGNGHQIQSTEARFSVLIW